MIIPVEQINKDTLEAIIEDFILREGTDYGLQEWSLDDKKQQVHAQLMTGEIVIVYSELHETINILPKQQFTE